MKRFSMFVLLMGLSLAGCAGSEAQIFRGPDAQRQAQKAAQKQGKARIRATRKQQKALLKQQKAQMKAAKRAQRGR